MTLRLQGRISMSSQPYDRCAFINTGMQYYNYRIDRKVYRCNMFKDPCLVALKRQDQSPLYLVLKSLYT
jgi:hypothetical protein